MNRLRTRNQREQNVLIEFLPDDRRRNNTNADAIKNCLLDRGKTAEFNNFAWVQLIFFLYKRRSFRCNAHRRGIQIKDKILKVY